MTSDQLRYLNEIRLGLNTALHKCELMAVDDEISNGAKAEQYDLIVGSIYPYWARKENMTAAQAVDHLVEEWRVGNLSS